MIKITSDQQLAKEDRQKMEELRKWISIGRTSEKVLENLLAEARSKEEVDIKETAWLVNALNNVDDRLTNYKEELRKYFEDKINLGLTAKKVLKDLVKENEDDEWYETALVSVNNKLEYYQTEYSFGI